MLSFFFPLLDQILFAPVFDGYDFEFSNKLDLFPLPPVGGILAIEKHHSAQ